jgi:ketosteroid isomerase-like protein
MTPDIVQELITRKHASLDAWVNGRPMWGLFSPEKVTLMNPFGGYSQEGNDSVRPMQNRAITNFERGEGASVELVHAMVGGDLVCLVTIERARVKFAGRDELHRWELRVTEVFEREADDWRIIHRHADPLLPYRTMDEVLALLEPNPIAPAH